MKTKETSCEFSCQRSHGHEGTLWIVRSGETAATVQAGLNDGRFKLTDGARVGHADMPFVVVDTDNGMIGYLNELARDAGETINSGFRVAPNIEA